ncbi:MAG TPA: hypothetical protein VLJ42_01100 [Solirubrobacteraceae bacterium]|nr:hypothetical protein [Solirubrobacteraceae bacterium]
MATPLHSTDPSERALELLAAAVLHALVSAAGALTLVEIAVACERNPASQADLQELSTTLRGLIDDDLVTESDAGFEATRAARRADQLSF